MAKKQKKRKKLTKRARQEASPQPQAAPAEPEAATPPAKPGTHSPEMSHPTALGGQSNAAPVIPPKQSKVAAAFAPTDSRGPDGIDKELAETEYPAIRRDLRKLGLTILCFSAIIAVLTLIGSQTTVIGDAGRELFKLWQ